MNFYLPYVLTVLSIPDGFPWIIFSPAKAHLFNNSSSDSPNTNHPSCFMSIFTVSEQARRAAENATQSAADEPRPAPSGRSEVTTTVAGLNLMQEEDQLRNQNSVRKVVNIKKEALHTLGLMCIATEKQTPQKQEMFLPLEYFVLQS